jgi:hypothetical protein
MKVYYELSGRSEKNKVDKVATSQVVLNNVEMELLLNRGEIILEWWKYQELSFEWSEEEMFIICLLDILVVILNRQRKNLKWK